MGIKLRFLGLTGGLFVFAGLSQMAACTTDDTDSSSTGGAGGSTATSNGGASDGGASDGGNAGNGTGGTHVSSGTSTSTGTSPSGTVCANPALIEKAAIADFDGYDGVSELGKWSFALGGDSSVGVYAGPFGYGDRTVGTKTDAIETFDAPSPGYNDSAHSVRIADSMAQKYGGGLGIWLSTCINATKFKGISFWVRGNCPTGQGSLTLPMQETTPVTPAKAGDLPGTCSGTSTTCIHPTFNFTVTDTWTQIQVPWTAFKAGDAAGTAITPDGRNITQLQLGVGLKWVPDATGAYVATLAPYELETDSWEFY